MTIKSTLEDAKDRLDALLTYANSVTEKSDTNIGDAIYSLSNGYNSGYTVDTIAGAQISGDIVFTVTEIKESAFFGNTLITSVRGDNVTTMRGSIFKNCTGITNVYFPAIVNSTSTSQFQGCTGLTKIGANTFPAATSVFNAMFYACSNLQSAIFPKGTGLSGNAFRECTSLTSVDLGAKNSSTSRGSINSSAFRSDTALTTLVLRMPVACKLANIDAFTGTPFESGGTGGTIYVPNDLITFYQTDTNWATIHGYGTITWKAIENSIYDGYYVDGTAIE